MAEKKTIDLAGVEIDNNLAAPVIITDGIQGFTLSQNNLVRINLVQDLLLTNPQGEVPEMPVTRRVVARLVMTLEQFYAIDKWTSQVAQDIRGAAASAAPEAPQAETDAKPE